MNALQTTAATQRLAIDNSKAIVQHHEAAVTYGRKTREHVLAAGRLLWQQKSSLKHGEWLPWIKKNLPFNRRTALNYINAYESTDIGKWEINSHLKSKTGEFFVWKPMLHQEAQDCCVAIQGFADEYGAALLRHVPTFQRLWRIQSDETYKPEFDTFEAFLESRGLDYDWFKEYDELLRAVVDWSNDGTKLHDLLWTELPKYEVVHTDSTEESAG
jgi:hypothetical protein